MSLLAREPELRPPDAEAVVERLSDIAAWLRVERNVGDVASAAGGEASPSGAPLGGAPEAIVAPATVAPATVVPAAVVQPGGVAQPGGAAGAAPTIPPPNSSPLPAAGWGTAEGQTLR